MAAFLDIKNDRYCPAPDPAHEQINRLMRQFKDGKRLAFVVAPMHTYRMSDTIRILFHARNEKLFSFVASRRFVQGPSLLALYPYEPGSVFVAGSGKDWIEVEHGLLLRQDDADFVEAFNRIR